MNNSNKFWDKISKNYDIQVNKKYKKTYQDTIELSKKYLNSNSTVLDFGCSTGITTVDLAKYVKKIIAIDISKKMIGVAEIKTSNQKIKNIDYFATDIFDPKFNGLKVDVVFAFNILYFVDNIDNLLNRIIGLLSPAGFFITATDCLGKTRSFQTILMSLLSKLGIIPFMKFYKIKELENFIKKHDFDIIEKQNLYINPPNYFIVAKKK